MQRRRKDAPGNSHPGACGFESRLLHRLMVSQFPDRSGLKLEGARSGDSRRDGKFKRKGANPLLFCCGGLAGVLSPGRLKKDKEQTK